MHQLSETWEEAGLGSEAGLGGEAGLGWEGGVGGGGRTRQEAGRRAAGERMARRRAQR